MYNCVNVNGFHVIKPSQNINSSISKIRGEWGMAGGSTTFRWILQMHKDVPKAAKFYSEGLDFSIKVCTLRWAELQSGPLKLALLHSQRSARLEIAHLLFVQLPHWKLTFFLSFLPNIISWVYQYIWHWLGNFEFCTIDYRLFCYNYCLSSSTSRVIRVFVVLFWQLHDPGSQLFAFIIFITLTR